MFNNNMNKTILLFLIILMIPIVMAVENCKGTMFVNEIPCSILLPVNVSVTPCNTIGLSVYNNATLLYTETMGELNKFNCNGTFNQTPIGTYTFLFGTGDSGSITIEEDENQQYYLYVVALIIFFILLWIDYKIEDGWFTMVAGILAMIVGISLYVSGFPNLVNDFLRVGIALPFWGVGAYLILVPVMKFFEEWK